MIGEPTKKPLSPEPFRSSSSAENSGRSQSFLASLCGTLRSITRPNGLVNNEVCLLTRVTGHWPSATHLWGQIRSSRQGLCPISCRNPGPPQAGYWILSDGQEPNGFAVQSRRAEGSHIYSYMNRPLSDLQTTSLQSNSLQTTSRHTPAKR